MSKEAKEIRDQGLALIAKAKSICDHANHSHQWDSDGPGYTCRDCGEYGYGPCPEDWPCVGRGTAAA